MSAETLFRWIAHVDAKKAEQPEDKGCAYKAANHNGKWNEQDGHSRFLWWTSHIGEMQRGFNG